MPDNNSYTANYTLSPYTCGYTLSPFTCGYNFDTDTVDNLLLEDAFQLLLESGDLLLLE